MHEPRKAPPQSVPDLKAKSPKPAIRLDDLIPTAKVLGGHRVIFGVRATPLSKPQPSTKNQEFR